MGTTVYTGDGTMTPEARRMLRVGRMVRLSTRHGSLHGEVIAVTRDQIILGRHPNLYNVPSGDVRKVEALTRDRHANGRTSDRRRVARRRSRG